MFDKPFFLRLLWAALGVFFFWKILPSFLHILKFTLDADLLTIITWVVAAAAVFYVFKGE